MSEPLSEPEHRAARRAEAMARLSEAAREAGLVADLWTAPVAVMLLYRDGRLVCAYRPGDRCCVTQPHNRRHGCTSWREALEAATKAARL